MYDRLTCALPGQQPGLVAAVSQAAPAGVPVVAVFVHGGAFCLDNDTLSNLDAILDAWYPGALCPVLGAPALCCQRCVLSPLLALLALLCKRRCAARSPLPTLFSLVYCS
jgi:hypothetical protein